MTTREMPAPTYVAKNYNGVQINQSPTIVARAGEFMADCRNRIMVLGEDGSAFIARNVEQPALGSAVVEAGYNDATGTTAGMVEVGEEIDIQIKDIGIALAGEEIFAGMEVCADTDGRAIFAAGDCYVLGFALESANENEYFPVQIAKYYKPASGK